MDSSNDVDASRASCLVCATPKLLEWRHERVSLVNITHVSPEGLCMPTNDLFARPRFPELQDAWLLAGVRTPFVDYTQALSLASPIDLGIKVAREVLARSGASAADVGTVIASSMAQTSYDAYVLPRHIGLYAGVPVEVPAHLVQRVCGSGIEIITPGGRHDYARPRVARAVRRRRVHEPQSHRGLHPSFRFPARRARRVQGLSVGSPARPGMSTPTWAAPRRTSRAATTSSRPDVDAYAARSFERAIAAQQNGFLAGEICAVKNETFEMRELSPRGLKLLGKEPAAERDTHIRPTPLETLAKHPPRVRRSADRRQQLGDRRWRRRRAGRLQRLPEAAEGAAARARRTPAWRWACRRRSWASAR